ncbi:MAG: RdgB/HAM1 family non-canonical purine NTP pyrophosphatase [Acidobacteriota bacterium]|nr:RdgB/HAM1 family non-canonical purine NTP pyrophosphatase [Acidobacteriota bacterium]
MPQLADLLIATHNVGKLRELASLLKDAPVRLRTLAEFPQVSSVEETGQTFAENASLKARFYATATQCWTLADDSGLMVDALGGAPGVFSARHAGIAATDGQRIARLLFELESVGATCRRARFICCVAICDPATGETWIFDGCCEGQISDVPRGTNGFGYDAVFVPDGYEQTFGELPEAIKQQISHRARAFGAAYQFIRTRFPQMP